MKKYLKNKVRNTFLFPIARAGYKKIDYSVKKTLNRLRGNSLILLYHRIDTINSDPHGLCVTPDNFYNHLRFLKENYRIIPLGKLVQNLQNSNLDKKDISITFDDGYADNLHHALPILEKLDIPATFFITAGIINKKDFFHWDERRHDNRPLSKEEFTKLAESDFVEIGAHTISHPRLAKISHDEQRHEIVESKKMIENILNKRVISFAYPFGGVNTFTKDTINIVRDAGYKYACSNIHNRVINKSDKHSLPRHIVRNWDINTFIKEFNRFI